MSEWTEASLCRVAARYFEWWRHPMVPNFITQHGREIDLLIVTKNKMVWEVEIKTSTADWKNDLKKRIHPLHAPRADDLIPSLYYYLVPIELTKPAPCIDGPMDWRHAHKTCVIPSFVHPSAGVAVVTPRPDRVGEPSVWMIRRPKRLHREKVSDVKQWQMLMQGTRRYWKHVAPPENAADRAKEMAAVEAETEREDVSC